MIKEEFNKLKYGDVISQGSLYFMVFRIFDDEFIDTQELSDVGVENEFGYTHSNIHYKFSEVVYNSDVLNAIKEWFTLKETTKEWLPEPYSFIEGYCKARKK